MTGRQLLAELNKLPGPQLELEVRTEGCDCYGDVEAVVVEKEESKSWVAEAATIVLCRSSEARGVRGLGGIR